MEKNMGLKEFEGTISLRRGVAEEYFPDAFSRQQILKVLEVKREYFINGDWLSGRPNKRPEGARIVFSNIEELAIAEDVAKIWKALSETFISRPTLPEEIIERIVESRQNGSKRVLFTPWGSAPQSIEPGAKERRIFSQINKVQKIFAAGNVKSEILILPADVYATEIDSRPPEETNQYFTQIENLAKEYGFITKRWSQIREEEGENYNLLKEKLTDERLRQVLPLRIREQAAYQAQRWSGYANDEKIRRAAYEYLKERIIEAIIIDKIYAPIKVSAVARGKDAFVDDPLPRIYVIPEEDQFPWLPKRGKQDEKLFIK